MSEPVKRNTPEEMIAAIQAWQRGEMIEAEIIGVLESHFCPIGDLREPDWNFAKLHYRPKPKPREFWINVYANSVGDRMFVHASESEARQSKAGYNFVEMIHVGELL